MKENNLQAAKIDVNKSRAWQHLSLGVWGHGEELWRQVVSVPFEETPTLRDWGCIVVGQGQGCCGGAYTHSQGSWEWSFWGDLRDHDSPHTIENSHLPVTQGWGQSLKVTHSNTTILLVGTRPVWESSEEKKIAGGGQQGWRPPWREEAKAVYCCRQKFQTEISLNF